MPDNQEVFAHAIHPYSAIIELVEPVSEEQASTVQGVSGDDEVSKDKRAVAFHVDEFCRLGGDSYSIDEEVRQITAGRLPNAPAYATHGNIHSTPKPVQTAATATDMREIGTRHDSGLWLLLFRLKEKATDLLVTVTSKNPDHDQFLLNAMPRIVERIAETVNIVNWTLFDT